MNNTYGTLNRIVIGALCAVAMSLATAANAQNFQITSSTSDSEAISYSLNGGPPMGALTGPYDATINGVQNVPVFCVDVTHEINFNAYTADLNNNVTDAAGSLDASTGFYNGGLSSALNAGAYGATNLGTVGAQQRADEIAYLCDTYINATTFTSGSVTDNFAAISIAIWDIVQNGGNGGYTAGSSFKMLSTGGYTPLIATYETQALDYYESTPNPTNNNVVWVQSPAVNGKPAQEFMYVNPVPEPGVVVTTVSLLGMVGLGMVRGRRRAARNA